MTAPNTLGEYLRARRELVDPARVGLRVAGVRRTPGLRREEVATLVGISADYYLRLEQGRDRNPSPHVLEAVAKVFGLDATATRYLLSLAANRHATALSSALRPGENRLRSVFLDPAERDLYPDWPRAIESLVASFRVSIGTDSDDARIAQLVGELSLASEPFRKLWARHDVRALAGGEVRMHHPEAGPLALRREKLPIGDSGGQVLAIYHAEPGSETARALASLAEERESAARESTAAQVGEPTSPRTA